MRFYFLVVPSEQNSNFLPNEFRRMKPASLPLANARRTTEKYYLLFSFCARRIFSSFNEKSIFLWASCFDKQSGGAGLYFLQGNGGIPPQKPPPVDSLILGLGRNPRGLRLSFFKKSAATNYKTNFNLSRTSFNNSTDVLKL